MSGVIDLRRDTVVRPGTYIVGVAGLCLLLQETPSLSILSRSFLPRHTVDYHAFFGCVGGVGDG